MAEDLLVPRFLYVQDLALQRQDRLEAAAAGPCGLNDLLIIRGATWDSAQRMHPALIDKCLHDSGNIGIQLAFGLAFKLWLR